MKAQRITLRVSARSLPRAHEWVRDAAQEARESGRRVAGATVIVRRATRS